MFAESCRGAPNWMHVRIRRDIGAARAHIRPMNLDADTCHAACIAKDKRFDGRFYVGVKSTGIYCRCICPARTPKRENRTFWPSAAAAEAAGFRRSEERRVGKARKFQGW